jgi:hypothetical protein
MATPVMPEGTEPTQDFTPDQLNQLSKKSKMKDIEPKVISWTKQAYTQCKTIRQTIERQWYINLAFYSGKQNISTIPISHGSSATGGVRLYTPTAPYYRSRPIYNRIRPIVRKELAKLTAQKPSASIIPSTSDEQDQAAAKAGEQIWESVFRRKKLEAIHRQTQMWARVTGNGFTKCYWDPTAVNPDTRDQLGDFCYQVITPFHLFVPDILALDIEDQPYIIQVTTRTPEWVRINYPGVNPEPNVMEASDILNDSFLNLVGANNYRKNSVLCFEVWVKANNVEFMPNGGMFLIIGETLVEYVEGNPYTHQQYPFAKIDNISTSRFYSESVVTDLISVQREYNRTRGQIIEAKNTMAHPQLLSAAGAIEANKITTEPGQVIEYKIGFPVPQPLPLQNLPNYVIQELNSQLLDFDDISGQHDVSKGQAPPGVTAATAINFLQEQDDTMLSESFQSIEAYYEKIAYQTLCYASQYWTMPRMVKVAGKGEQFDVMAFKGADLRSNTDIRVEAGSALPTSKAAKQAFIMDLMQLGFVPPEQGLELMEMGGIQKLYEQLQIDTAQANRENMKMANVTPDLMQQYLQTFIPQPDPMQALMGQLGGQQPQATLDPMGQPTVNEPPQQPPFIDPTTGGPLVDATGQPTEPPLIVPVNSFDNHTAHINAHNNYRKSQEYDNLAPELKKLFEDHVNQHMQALGIPPGMPDPTTNQPPIPMDQSNSQSAGGATDINTQAGSTGASTPQVGQASNNEGSMPPVGANMQGGVIPSG